MAYLTDGRAVSFAETYMGIIENYRLAEIVGSPTAGTNGNINPFSVPGGYTISWTGMKVLRQDGTRHHGIGIQPDVPCSRTIAGVAAGRDEQLEQRQRGGVGKPDSGQQARAGHGRQIGVQRQRELADEQGEPGEQPIRFRIAESFLVPLARLGVVLWHSIALSMEQAETDHGGGVAAGVLDCRAGRQCWPPQRDV